MAGRIASGLPRALLRTAAESTPPGRSVSVTDPHVTNVTIGGPYLWCAAKASFVTWTKMPRRTRRCLRNGYVAR